MVNEFDESLKLVIITGYVVTATEIDPFEFINVLAILVLKDFRILSRTSEFCSHMA